MKKTLAPLLVAMMILQGVSPLPIMAQSGLGAGALDNTAMLDETLNVPNGSRRISLSVDNQNIRNVLYALSDTGKFNLVMDDSVTGNVTIDLSKVTINQALQSIASLGNLKILKQSGNIYLVMSRQTAQAKGLDRQLSKVVALHYTNATRVASMLNNSLLANASPTGTAAAGGGGAGAAGGNVMQPATAEARTNSIILIGTAQTIALAEAAIAKMDVPRQSKTFYLSHSNALDVATLLAGSAFNDGVASFAVGGAAASGSAAGGAAAGGINGTPRTPSSLRVERQDVQEGTGINVFGSNGDGVTSGLSSSVTLRGFVKTQDNATVSPESALIIPDTRQNAITIMGTAEQIALAESLIPTFDAQLPQVSIEASLVEITDTNNKQLGTRWGIADGKLQFGFNNQPLSSVSGNGLIGLSTITDITDVNALARSGIAFNTSPAVTRPDYAFQIRNLISQNKAKVLANPTVVATHDTESIISIVDEIVRRVVTTVDESGFATQTVEIGEAGIVMDILPKIGEDGTVSMRIRPSVTSVLREETVLGNLVTLLQKRDLLAQNVRLKDGETLVIGGLIQQRELNRTDKLPGVAELPIVGAMFRASQRTGTRSELVMMITPHIINNTKLTPVISTTATDTGALNNLAGGK
ncbi:secretin N-terminal domain-containing protein [Vampirovibrio chlorellavorus]|uniref:secretin N-terminal domain-containing protein n=1 Tax=Vampirovibrio chlorellavorus TaxID=758823 RepID=UPI0026EA3011|nr:secretin N-terminal domain-containing protein [Vampirovibrio chlorellavorus]